MFIQLALFFSAHFATLELGRILTTGGTVSLLAPASGLLLASLIGLTPRRLGQGQVLFVAGIASLLSSAGLHADPWPQALAFTLANVAAGAIGVRLIQAALGPERVIRNVRDSLYVVYAFAASAAGGALLVWLELATRRAPDAAFQLAHIRFVSDLVGLLTFGPLAVVGWRGLKNTLRGRVVELVGLVVVTVGMTQVFWAAADLPRPGLLAPMFVWAAFRFQLAGSLINVPFVAVAFANSVMNRGPWAASAGVHEMLVGLWLHVLVSSTFLVLSAGVLERRRDQALLTRVLDEVSDGIIVIGEDGVIKKMNRSAAVHFTVRQTAAIGLSALDLIGDAWRLRNERNGRLFETEITAHRLRGEPFPARVSLTPLDTDDERNVLAVVHDLSRQRQTERSLELSEAQWHAVLAALPDAILIHDEEGRYTNVHTPANGPLALAPERFIGKRVWDILPADEAAPIDAMRERVRVTRTPAFLEYQATLDGRALWFHSHIVPLGETSTLSVLRDITEQRTLQDQLRQAQRLEAIGRLAGGVAHDFNNLLTVIGGSTELVLADLPARDPRRRTLEEVRQASDRAAALTQQLLAFGRRQVLQVEVFALRQVVQDCEQMLRRLIGEHIGLTCVIQSEVPAVRADRNQIEQVIVNLAVNARDAMPTGGELTIETGVATIPADASAGDTDILPGHFVTLSVRDTGVGIPEDVVEHIFEPFFTTKGVGQGTGLGLATVYGIARQSGGFITVRSQVGSGTTFTLFLPAVMASAEIRNPVEQPAATPAIVRGCETVLLVEDEDGVRDIAKRFLTSAGYRVLSAASGDEALTMSATLDRPLDVLVTDVVMPGMSGPQLAARLRPEHPQLRTIFMSGYPNDALLVHDLPAQQALFLQKPFSRQALTDALREALNGDPQTVD